MTPASRRRLLLAAVLPLGGLASAQDPSGSLRGVVHDQDFGAPLAGAEVHVVETEQKTIASDQGAFVLRGIPPGNYTIVVSKTGYTRQVKTGVVVSAGRVAELRFSLTGDFSDMEEFVVQDLLQIHSGSDAALLQLRFENPALIDSIGSDLLGRSGASDAASALRLVPGASLQDGKSAVIRGLPDRYISSQMNGVRLPTADDDKRAVELDQFPASIIDSIQVSKTFTPDQQGDASGGAVNVRLKGVPDEPFFFKISAQSSYNSQVTGRSRFLSYEGGGVNSWGDDGGRRSIQTENIGGSWDGAVGVSESGAPSDYKWSLTSGGKLEIAEGVAIGGSASLFHERDSSFYDHGSDDSHWVESPGEPMTPKAFQGTIQDGDFKTGLFDVTRGSMSVQRGGLGAFGIETEHHRLGAAYLYSRTAEDTATRSVDTRGKQHFFPGHDPDDPMSPGHDEPDAAPYLRLETLDYSERTAKTLQFTGRHEFPLDFGAIRTPELDWLVARSSADLHRPDKRQFGSAWYPERVIGPITIPGAHRPFKPSANFTLGNLQRIWTRIHEESDQYAVNLKVPFEQWSGEEGYAKFGLFRDEVRRTFDQDTFSNFGDNSSFDGDFRQPWSRVFPFEDHPITASEFDVDYDARQDISAWYAMLDVPITSRLGIVGGFRFESTEIGITNDPEEDATWYPPGSLAPTQLNPGEGDAGFSADHVLPSIAIEYRPTKDLTFRGSYSKTVARQTFKELSPILQQEYLGGPIFIGNPDLEMSTLRNYDLRVDYTPYEGGLVSASWFRKDIRKPIEYLQRVASFDFTTAVNYPRGRIEGWEFEARQRLGQFWTPLDGLAIGANATLIDSEVTLPDDEAAGFELPNIAAPMRDRDMTNAPQHLYNLYLTYDLERTGTQLALFYTMQGDTLLAGAGQSNGNFIPNVYAKEFDTLNLSLSQSIGKYVKLQFQAKNLTDPHIDTVYRSGYIGEDVMKSSYTSGIEYSFSIGSQIKF